MDLLKCTYVEMCTIVSVTSITNIYHPHNQRLQGIVLIFSPLISRPFSWSLGPTGFPLLNVHPTCRHSCSLSVSLYVRTFSYGHFHLFSHVFALSVCARTFVSVSGPPVPSLYTRRAVCAHKNKKTLLCARTKTYSCRRIL